jgi:hypothetical protein
VLLIDPLLPPAEWPGVRAAYRFAPPSAEAPASLVLSFLFDPARVVGDGAAPPGIRLGEPGEGAEPAEGDGAKRRAREALLRYAAAAAQLADPDTALAVTQSVLPDDGGAVGDGAAIRGELAAFAGRVVAQLQAVLADGAAAPVSLEIPVRLDPAGLARRTDDVFPVAVSLALSRPPERVDAEARARAPRTVSAAMPVPPDLDGDAGLARFAAGFEAAFAGFDGAGGAARLAVRHGAPGAPEPTGSASPWGVRWSAGHGIHVAFPGGDAPCFAPAPLGAGLVDGTARVPTLDPATLEAAYADQVFAGIDLDDWARTYLAAVDEVLSPAVGAAVAVLDGAAYRALAEVRRRLARALAGSLVPVFPALPGDAAAARERFERGALAALAPAHAVSAVVQVPAEGAAEGAAAGAAAPGSAAPRLCGSVGAPGTDGGEERGLAVGDGTLPVRTTTPASPAFLTFPATAERPGRAAGLELAARFRPHSVELPPATPGEASDHARPERLRFVLDAPGDPLAPPPGTVGVPVPVRSRPPAPVLQEQRAEQAPDDDSGDAGAPLLWDYAVTLAHAGEAAQDDLWVSVAWNLPLDGPGPRAPRAAAEPDPARALFEALASFVAAWPTLRPHVAALPRATIGGGDGTPAPARVLAALLEQVQPVARAWSAQRGTADGGMDPPAAPAAEAAPPAGDAYVVSFADAFTTGVLRVFARAGETDGRPDPAGIAWPLVDGRANGAAAPAADAAAPDGTGCWFTADYPYAPRAGTLELTWPRLDAAARQTASSTFRTVRNARLRVGTETSPELVFRTAPVSFPAPVMPAIVVPRRAFAAGAALAATLEEALRPFAAAGRAAGRDRLLDVALTCRFQVPAPEADGEVPEAGGEAPWSEVPVLLVRGFLLAPASAAPSEAVLTLRGLAGRLAGDVDAWYAAAAPPTAAARLALDVALRASGEEAQVPVLRAPELEVEVPAGWWPPGSETAAGRGEGSRSG